MSGIKGMFDRFLEWLRNLFFSKNMELTILGIQSAGKTTFLNIITNGVFTENIKATSGFNVRNVKKGNVNIKIWDIGGQERYRPFWDRYCRGIDCLIFMVDSSDYDKLEVATKELFQILSKPLTANIPLLVIANKNDIQGALSDKDISSSMNLSSIVDREIECISVSCRTQQNINTALKWILNHSSKSK